jgi:hypothetical protein
MRRKRKQRRQGAAPSMFPFLAVLICTMGALISLLVMGVRQAQVHAHDIIEATQVDNVQRQIDAQRNQKDLENYQWRSLVLRTQREEQQGKISSNRLTLSHLEQHARELEEELERLVSRHESLQHQLQEDSGIQAQRTNRQAELKKLDADINVARTKLAQARLDRESATESFAIIPYAGDKGTNRRPIYIECVAAGIIIQPEGILITEIEMAGPPGPGNPLDACLRAEREFYFEHTVDESIAPYPLLIVRSSGVRSYGVARQAMKNWQHEFGYELISDELKLAYPRPQPALAQQLQQAIKAARSRQQALAATMPSRYRLSPTTHHTNQPFDGESPQRKQQSVVDALNPQRTREDSGQQSNVTSPMPLGTTINETTSSDGQGGSQGGSQGSSQGGSQGSSQGGSQGSSQGSSRVQAAPGLPMGMPGRKPGWALKKPQTLGPAVTRGVRVLCTVDQLVLIPAQGERGAPMVVRIEGTMQQSIDPFVAALHQHIQRWGLALAGGYWKPELHIEVAGGGEQHFYLLQNYLKRSGIKVTQRIQAKP